MIAVAVIGILAAIAYPNYLNYVRESRRADGRAALMEVRLAQEKWRANNTSYATATDLGYPKSSSAGHYSITVTSSSANGFTAAATPQGAQASDANDCGAGNFIVTQNGPDLGSAAKRRCWGQ